ncbi:hypothetical protein [Rhodococcus sp. 11-3]|uniref:hypothetical protein n=1 Tax=Rhodococcus sp. 11-3 TaxID=2854796 RepID=UPI00203AF4E2|nr:hypothetical protein [Rhodococcus sp. 11-3]USC17039.1 hypothetical protein KZJ41_09305 [Rhodococcus sp. 11-3]
MAKLVLKDCFIEVDGVDFSSHVNAASLSMKKAAVETTNFSGGGKEVVAGLKDDTIEITFQQDFAPASVDAVLYPLYDLEQEFTVKVRPTAAAVSASNPEYSATCVLLEYTALSGKVGDLSEIKVTFPTQRSGIARATA